MAKMERPANSKQIKTDRLENLNLASRDNQVLE